LHELDSKSINFRYPESREGEQTQDKKMHINLNNLKNRMDELYNFFDSCYSELSHRLEWKKEFALYIQYE